MSDAARELERLQRWMQEVITHPRGVVAGIESPEARKQIDVLTANVEDVVSRSRALTSVDRLAIYANAYFGRLLECMREEFPALRHAVGPEAFDALAGNYLIANPSRSYTLAELSGRFPQYLAETRPPREPEDDAEADWPDFLIDLATLERTYSEVFDGPGTEDLAPFSTEALAAIPAARWPDLRLVTVPCLRLLALKFPVHEYATALRRQPDEEHEIPAPLPTFLAVTRRDYVVRRVPLSRTQFELLCSLSDGASLGDALAACAETAGADLDGLAANLRQWFEEWAVAPLFSQVVLPPER